jgi:hypothetical protein
VTSHSTGWKCSPVPASFNEQAFREATLIFCGSLTPAGFQTAFARLEQQSRELEAAQVAPVSGLTGKKRSHRATHPAS